MCTWVCTWVCLFVCERERERGERGREFCSIIPHINISLFYSLRLPLSSPQGDAWRKSENMIQTLCSSKKRRRISIIIVYLLLMLRCKLKKIEYNKFQQFQIFHDKWRKGLSFCHNITVLYFCFCYLGFGMHRSG